VHTGSKFKFQDFEECSHKPFYNGPLFGLHLYVFLYAMMLVYSIISFVLEYLFCHLFYAAKLRAPKWCERRVGASFGFGGKLVSFRPKLHAAGASEVSLLDKLHFLLYFLLFFSTYSKCFSQVFLHNLVTEDSLVSRSSEFESAIQNGEKSLLKTLCDKKSQESEYASVS